MKSKSIKFTLKETILIAIFSALTAVMAQISIKIPFSPVPITLQVLSVCLSASILGKKCATISQLIYIMVGAAGFPVFSNFNSGLNALLGPTGGYIISFPFMAFITGFVNEIIDKKMYSNINFIANANSHKLKYYGILSMFLSMLSGLIVCYLFGTLWLGLILKLSLVKALIMGIGWYLPLDIVKIFLASFLAYEIKRSLVKAGLVNYHYN